jgi:predicted RNA-binding protein with RPS1 domain
LNLTECKIDQRREVRNDITGIVNITNFGCFVDIGVKGLVHISQLKAGFVSDVNEVETTPTCRGQSNRG